MRIGFVSMPLTGHLNPMTALARKLQSRGHEVVFLGLPDAEAAVRAANLDFVPFGEKEYPVGSTAARYAHLAKLHGNEVIRYSSHEMHPRRCETMLQRLPEKLTATGVEALIIDTIHFFVELIPMSLGMPTLISGIFFTSIVLDQLQSASSIGHTRLSRKLSLEIWRD